MPERNALTALKWHYQPEHRGNSWRATLRKPRAQVQLGLSDNPSLKPYLAEALAFAKRLFQRKPLPWRIAYQLGQDLEHRFSIRCPSFQCLEGSSEALPPQRSGRAARRVP